MLQNYQFKYSFDLRDVDLRELLSPEAQKSNPNTVYDLIANVVHDGQPNKGTYRVHILHKGTATWHELQDLHVVDVLPQMITLSESYIQVKNGLNARNMKINFFIILFFIIIP